MLTSTSCRHFCLAVIALCSSPFLLAEDRVIREHSFSAAEFGEIRINASVGSIDILPTEGDEIKVVLDIEGKDEGWFHNRKDVSEVDLETRVRGERLILEQTGDDTSTEWTVLLPVLTRTSIHLGVGSIDGELGGTDVDIDLGVGEINLDYPLAAAGAIDLNVGVGSAVLRGTREINTHKAFVSQQLSGTGEGERDIDIHVGVGSVDLRLL